jgi:hypothetical protein
MPIGVDHHRRAASDCNSADSGDVGAGLLKGPDANGVIFVCGPAVADGDIVAAGG